MADRAAELKAEIFADSDSELDSESSEEEEEEEEEEDVDETCDVSSPDASDKDIDSDPNDRPVAGPAPAVQCRGPTRAGRGGKGRGRPRGQKAPSFREGWSATDDFRPPPMPFTRLQGPTGNYGGFSPVQIFMLYFNADVWDLLVTETNRYAMYADQFMQAWQAKPGANNWANNPTNTDEMKAFVALLLTMGIKRLPQYHMYWSTTETLINRFFPSIMSRNRFQAILRYLHLADNCAPHSRSQEPRNKLAKLQPFLDIILPTFYSIYTPGQQLSPNESMLSFKGRPSFVQNMPKKPVKRGMKAFSLNESKTGYTCSWQLYTGHQDYPVAPRLQQPKNPSQHHPSDLYVSGHVILDLIKGFENKGHIIYCDNYYTSPSLFLKLTQLGFGCCGTVKYASKGMPEIANPKKNKIKKGDAPIFHSKAGQLCISWFDKKCVNVLTTVGDCSAMHKRIRCRHGEDGHREVIKPKSIDDYNTFVGGTDLANKYFQYYNHTHRSVKWWKRVFFHLLEVCMVNAHIVYSSIPDNVKLTSLKFRQAVIKGLLEGWERDEVRRGRRSSREDLPARLTERGHFPGRVPGTSCPDCIVCSDRSKKGGRKQTTICCTKCDRPMCAVPCFERYHTNLVLK